MNEAKLTEALESCFNDWDEDFDIDVEQTDDDDGCTYFSVIISHDISHYIYEFEARVNCDGVCEMAYSEDCWQLVNQANIFSWMWFEAVLEQQKPSA